MIDQANFLPALLTSTAAITLMAAGIYEHIKARRSAKHSRLSRGRSLYL